MQQIESESVQDILLEILYAVDSSDSISQFCEIAVNAINNIMNAPAAYICIFDSYEKRFKIEMETGLIKNRTHNICNLESIDGVMDKDVEGCYLTFSQFTINSERLNKNVIASCIEDRRLPDQDTTLIHVPLTSDANIVGILHVVLPTEQARAILNRSQALSLIANSITSGIIKINMLNELKQYTNNLEQIVKQNILQQYGGDSQLLQSDKLSSLGEMAAGIAHEVSQPLSGISLIVQGLMMAQDKSILNPETLHDKLNMIVKQVDRINTVITHLKTFANRNEKTRQEVDISKPLQDVFNFIGHLLDKKGIEVDVEMENGLPSVLADNNRLEQVFLNIISNARDAIENAEKKVEQLKHIKQKPAWVDSWRKKITVRAYKKEPYIVITISDTGCGIPQNIAGRIFQPFFTTKGIGHGTGLGLSIAYGIINEFGGTIEVQSEEMRGSNFIIKIPIYKSNMTGDSSASQ